MVDSVAALTPRAEIEGEMGDSVMGMQARLMSQELEKTFRSKVSKSNVVLIFLQISSRENRCDVFGSPGNNYRR